MVVAHNRVHWDSVWAGRFAQATGVTAVEAAAIVLISFEECEIFGFQAASRKHEIIPRLLKVHDRQTDRIHIWVA